MTALARGSIRRQLMTLLLSGAVVLGIVLFFVVQSFARQLAEESQDNILRASVTAILDSASVRQNELALDLPYSAFSMLGNLSDDRVFYAIHRDDVFLTGYQDLPGRDTLSPNTPQFVTAVFHGEDVRIVTAARRLAIDGKPILLSASIAQTRNGQRAILSRISRIAGALGLGFFVATAVLAIFASRSAISPLERLTASVTRRGPEDLRPVSVPVPIEMGPLVGALNSFMDRLRMSLSRSEDFIAEAAHRVRTPLATVRTQAETILLRVNRDDNRATLREMIRAIDESSRAAGQLLDHAMVSLRSDHLEAEDIDLAQMATELVGRMGPLADLRDIDLRLDVPGSARISGDPILVQNAMQNLLDNAIKYSLADGAVILSVHSREGQAQLSVQDQGLGFPIGDNTDLTDRFARGANSENIVGSGLGLTIVKEVADAHGASLSISNNKNGPGACVTLSFPLR